MKELYKSLLAVQSKSATLKKSKQGHGYKYTPLDEVLEHLKPLLRESGLIVWQTVEDVDGRVAVRTSVAHAESGQMLDSLAIAPEGTATNSRMSPIQTLGSDVTYLRRYSLSALFALASDEDADGAYNKTPEEQKWDDEKRSFEISSWITSAEEVLSGFVDKQTFTNLRKNAEQKFGTLPKEISKFLNDKFKEMGLANAQ